MGLRDQRKSKYCKMKGRFGISASKSTVSDPGSKTLRQKAQSRSHHCRHVPRICPRGVSGDPRVTPVQNQKFFGFGTPFLERGPFLEQKKNEKRFHVEPDPDSYMGPSDFQF